MPLSPDGQSHLLGWETAHPETAAVHYSALSGSAWNSALADPAPQRALQLVGAAISTFLHGYLPRS
jgi:hypothetical protein